MQCSALLLPQTSSTPCSTPTSKRGCGGRNLDSMRVVDLLLHVAGVALISHCVCASDETRAIPTGCVAQESGSGSSYELILTDCHMFTESVLYVCLQRLAQCAAGTFTPRSATGICRGLG